MEVREGDRVMVMGTLDIKDIEIGICENCGEDVIKLVGEEEYHCWECGYDHIVEEEQEQEILIIVEDGGLFGSSK